jgi:hypothetical protein
MIFCSTTNQKVIFFKFKKADFKRLFELMELPEWPTFPGNRLRMSGEEVFLRAMYELSSGDNKQNICECLFGREFSAQSRAFTYFIRFMYEKYHHLVQNNLQWWYQNGLIEQSYEAIHQKMLEQGFMEDANFDRVALFIDCNCLQSSVVGGGPAEAGANAARWDEVIQRAFYNGWKSVHGLKHQTVDCAFGMTVDICGPTSFRRNDLALLRISNINDRMAELQVDLPADEQLVIFGDSAYKRQSHITSYLPATGNASLRRWNAAMKKVRISIEWNYGHQASLFKYLQVHGKLKMMESSTVAQIYTVTTILRNFHICFEGCETSNYFNLSLPDDFIKHYMNGMDINIMA